MALQIGYDSPYSSTPIADAYHRIVNFQLAADVGRIAYTIAVYQDKAARDAGKMPIGHREVTYSSTTTPTFTEVVASASAPDDTKAFDVVVAALYGLLKQREEYEGATDV